MDSSPLNRRRCPGAGDIRHGEFARGADRAALLRVHLAGDAARHDVRGKVAPGPRMRADQMSSYALTPFKLVEGGGLSAADERLLSRWIEVNRQVLVDHWDGRIEFTEDVLDLLKPI